MSSNPAITEAMKAKIKARLGATPITEPQSTWGSRRDDDTAQLPFVNKGEGAAINAEVKHTLNTGEAPAFPTATISAVVRAVDAVLPEQLEQRVLMIAGLYLNGTKTQEIADKLGLDPDLVNKEVKKIDSARSVGYKQNPELAGKVVQQEYDVVQKTIHSIKQIDELSDMLVEEMRMDYQEGLDAYHGRTNAPVDDEDRAVGLHVLYLELGRLAVLAGAADAEGGDAEARRLAPRPPPVLAVDRRYPPEERAFALHSERGLGASPVGDVDDVVDEEPVTRNLQGVALAARHLGPGDAQAPLAVDVDVGVVGRGEQGGGGRQRLHLGETVAGLPHGLQRADATLLAARRDAHLPAVGAELPLPARLVVDHHRLGLLADQNTRLAPTRHATQTRARSGTPGQRSAPSAGTHPTITRGSTTTST